MICSMITPRSVLRHPHTLPPPPLCSATGPSRHQSRVSLLYRVYTLSLFDALKRGDRHAEIGNPGPCLKASFGTRAAVRRIRWNAHFNNEDIAMTYRVTGLAPADHAHLFAMDEAALAAINARRVTAMASSGFPCRVSLEDAREGEALILFHYVSHDVATPYRSAYAVYVRENATEAADYVDRTPPVFEGRPIALRGFDADGNLLNAALALPGQADARIRELFGQAEIAYIHAHNAAHGCFSAAIERT